MSAEALLGTTMTMPCIGVMGPWQKGRVLVVSVVKSKSSRTVSPPTTTYRGPMGAVLEGE